MASYFSGRIDLLGKATTTELEQLQDMQGLALNWKQRAREMLLHQQID
jgi:hypothetical protein